MKTKSVDCWKEWDKTLPWDLFLKYIRPYKHIRVGVGGGKVPFEFTYFKISKRELIKTVRMSRSETKFTVMTNPSIPNDIGVMYISEMRITILDKK